MGIRPSLERAGWGVIGGAVCAFLNSQIEERGAEWNPIAKGAMVAIVTLVAGKFFFELGADRGEKAAIIEMTEVPTEEVPKMTNNLKQCTLLTPLIGYALYNFFFPIKESSSIRHLTAVIMYASYQFLQRGAFFRIAESLLKKLNDEGDEIIESYKRLGENQLNYGQEVVRLWEEVVRQDPSDENRKQLQEVKEIFDKMTSEYLSLMAAPEQRQQ